MIKKTKRYIYKLVSIVTISSFFMTTVAWSMPEGSIGMLPRMETPSFLQISIPTELASVEEIYEAPAKQNPKLILNIQNIHGNYESQMQISKLLQYLYDQFGFKLLFAEGAADALDIDLIRFFPDAERNHKFADLMAQDGELTGIEYFMMDGPKDVEAVGIENAELYRKNYEAFKRVYRAKPEVDSFLDLFESRLETLSSRIFTPDTRRILSEWRKFESGHRDFLPYVKRLAVDAKAVLNLDLQSLFSQVEWPQITRLLALQSMEAELDRPAAEREKKQLLEFLKQQKVSSKITNAIETLDEKKISMSRSDAQSRQEDVPRYLFERLVEEAAPKGFKFHDYPAFSLWAGHLILQNELDSKNLFEEIEKVFTKILTELTLSEREKNLMELTRDEILLKKLLHLEVTRKEWERAVYRKDWMILSAMVGRLKKISDEMGRELKLNADDWARLQTASGEKISGEKNSLSTILESSYEFYDDARNRESVFFKTINDTMNEKGIEKAVVVTGGFHTDGLMDLFRENEFNASVLMPRIAGDLDNANYISTMMENKPSQFDIGTIEAILATSSVQIAQGRNFADYAAGVISKLIKLGLTQEDATSLVAKKLDIFIKIMNISGERPRLIITPRGDKAELSRPAKDRVSSTAFQSKASREIDPTTVGASRSEGRETKPPKVPSFVADSLESNNGFPQGFKLLLNYTPPDEDDPDLGPSYFEVQLYAKDVPKSLRDNIVYTVSRNAREFGAITLTRDSDGKGIVNDVLGIDKLKLEHEKGVIKENLKKALKNIIDIKEPFDTTHSYFRSEQRAIAAPELLTPARAERRTISSDSNPRLSVKVIKNGVSIRFSNGTSVLVNSSGITISGVLMNEFRRDAALKSIGARLAPQERITLENLRTTVSPKFIPNLEKVLSALRPSEPQRIVIPGIGREQPTSVPNDLTSFALLGAPTSIYVGGEGGGSAAWNVSTQVSVVAGGVFPFGSDLNVLEQFDRDLRQTSPSGVENSMALDPTINNFMPPSADRGAVMVVLDVPATEAELEGVLESAGLMLQAYAGAEIHFVLVQREGRVSKKIPEALSRAMTQISKKLGDKSPRIHFTQMSYRGLLSGLPAIRRDINFTLSGERGIGTKGTASNYKEIFITSNPTDDFRDVRSETPEQTLRLVLEPSDLATGKMNQYSNGGVWLTLLRALQLSQDVADLINSDGTINKSALSAKLKGLATALAALRKITASA